jgi:predicted TIM-barrel fold metal-dependent hydrolase
MSATEPFTNCHIHTFTHDHTPVRFVPPPLNYLLRIGWFRKAVLGLIDLIDPDRNGRIARYAEIVETSYGKNQGAVFEQVQGFYPEGTRFVVLPMDMTRMGLGPVKKSIDEQHDELLQLATANPATLIPFVAVDPRHPGIVEETRKRLGQGFAGIKLYPPIGYHPFDRRLWPLYGWANDLKDPPPILTHCSRPASVQFHGQPTRDMQADPQTGEVGNRTREELLTWYTDPDSYKTLLTTYPRLRVCLAHFGGAGDWSTYLEHPRQTDDQPSTQSWLSKIADMIRSGDYPNLWTDISYTLFADDEFVYLLKTLLTDESIRAKTLFGSDFYVVESARLEERHRAVRIRAVLGEDLFRTIAVTNPRTFLGR